MDAAPAASQAPGFEALAGALEAAAIADATCSSTSSETYDRVEQERIVARDALLAAHRAVEEERDLKQRQIREHKGFIQRLLEAAGLCDPESEDEAVEAVAALLEASEAAESALAASRAEVERLRGALRDLVESKDLTTDVPIFPEEIAYPGDAESAPTCKTQTVCLLCACDPCDDECPKGRATRALASSPGAATTTAREE